ncbi:MAG: DUF1800 domain-containing protein [Acidobacteria bacterium]|nr:DUF1800 domain-containing protein [Acidobacteriota bacterium]
MNQGIKEKVRERRSLLSSLAGGVGGRLDGRPGKYRMQRFMRTPLNPEWPQAGDQRGVPAAPSAAVVALNRMGFGPRPGDVDAFNALGATDPQRMQAYVAQQLDPDSLDDSALDARLAAAGFTTLDKTLLELWADHVVADPPYEERIRPLTETESMTFLRAVYSKKQLFEVMVEFWHNHFSIYGREFNIAPVWVHYDRDVIRANALGNFRQMLQADATSTAMLFYLDNYENSAAGPNENYARELFELHTLGAENYYGLIPRSQVPVDGNGVPVGFVDEDVFGAAKALTGWTVRSRSWDPNFGDTGEFFYYAPWHDDGPKAFLNVVINGPQAPMKDGEDLLDALAAHPGTGRFIARKLCRRLVGDSPPQSLVDQAAAVFTAQKDAPDQIRQVLQTILLSPEFLAAWGDKVKRPFEIAASALRAGESELSFHLDDSDTGTFYWLYSQTGHRLFGWNPPNGYPDFKVAWQSTTPRVMCWRLVNWLVDSTDDLGAYFMDLVGATPAGVRSANAIVDFWVDRVFGRTIDPGTRAELVDFMAQGFLPDLDLPLDTDDDTRTRLRSLVALMFMSPEFLWR